jgi:signal peptidase II
MHKQVFSLIILDQITKLVFSSRDFVFWLVSIQPVKNYGLAFGLDFGLLPNLILVILALGFFIYYYFTNRYEFGWLLKFMFMLIFAGAISNLIDRLYLGYVRDFINLGLGFTFNLADAFLVIGLIGLIVLHKDKKLEV